MNRLIIMLCLITYPVKYFYLVIQLLQYQADSLLV
ncbi:hypothetical protein CTER_4916 [Ruminiclostridium cellobioparum subsp. termitidis CT1112]|uniref:Uncharacterized protein n=1 Tax=Ruminiclostridium cellobioparum subsp. termitidis CT1112 TaxID=1195236 RepID=S0FHK6_RUMCE|nr:hypothetical protein CTER_4916 [Ruminiclostridium cellobioparum subsp. termitidis CT1112]